MSGLNYGPGLGTAIAGAWNSYRQEKDRQRIQAREDEMYRLGLEDRQRRIDWAMEDRANAAEDRRKADEIRNIQLGLQQQQASQNAVRFAQDQEQYARQQEQDAWQQEVNATLSAMRLLKAGFPQLAVREYQRVNPQYQGQVPQPDPQKPGHWLIDIDGDGQLDSVNPDDILNAYAPRDRKLMTVGAKERLVDPATGALVMDVDPRAIAAGGGGAVSATLQEANALFERMRRTNPDPRKTDDEIWLDAYAMATTAKSKDPAEAERNFYSGVLQKLLGGMIDPTEDEVRRTQELAWQITQFYRNQFGTESPGRFGLNLGSGANPGAGLGLSAPMQQAPGAQSQGGGTLPPAAAAALQEGKLTQFRNGQVWTLKNGQPVRVQ